MRFQILTTKNISQFSIIIIVITIIRISEVETFQYLFRTSSFKIVQLCIFFLNIVYSLTLYRVQACYQ